MKSCCKGCNKLTDLQSPHNEMGTEPYSVRAHRKLKYKQDVVFYFHLYVFLYSAITLSDIRRERTSYPSFWNFGSGKGGGAAT